MTTISADLVKTLREKTGVGMMECKKALVETSGDIEKAQEFLRKKGLADAAKRGDRTTAEGMIESYIHMGGQIGVILELNCETDFVARNENFKTLAKDIAMHIAASAPQYVSKEEVPADLVNKEKDILMAQPDMASKPENVREKIIEGRIEKFYEQICLMNQPFVKDPSVKIADLVNKSISTIGEKILVKRFVRFSVGES
ncbi:elongation factor Ts [bacterium (Candidatus Blackallbacteria) CG17_big_fil_post_rev_8_21_14_2_50_48_46]|uniref:Elongation factor Ts n=1 Tax=bacterium (Candidatus Blackallbacteria) CG17_big_fil_post_rev_8_21_14_2_50_48_46 TaxID=2014261 RepID=A0A2M7FYI9_9BACT|nr:MAG: elongation factor Ts [bacterium (Candidatus Blackallbacteria) CG18_big_fil_WC_8_21_14_2_50_49_26]PIW14106.1 MAG: elongation factor Ts [bacterium (Candidatus Blackallbacteria) CG17_big_fil_post_rev_8_21_14_2_50_48_46]PIW45836.1 MAG: elongation factor Ts [bacterium (Candidatus Blackallbacteria) CG13_big_fil_rev_8_21_14_2_50_49_14]